MEQALVTKNTGLYTASHDASGEPSYKIVTAEQADMIMAGDPQGGGNKWDNRTHWIKTTPSQAKAMYEQAMQDISAQRAAITAVYGTNKSYAARMREYLPANEYDQVDLRADLVRKTVTVLRKDHIEPELGAAIYYYMAGHMSYIDLECWGIKQGHMKIEGARRHNNLKAVYERMSKDQQTYWEGVKHACMYCDDAEEE